MCSEDKFWLGFWISAFTTIIVVVLLLCTYGKTSDTINMAKIQSEHTLKSECIRAHGNWGATDDDHHSPYSCKL